MEYLPGRANGARAEKREGGTFSGEVWFDPLLPTTDDVTMNTVYFAPGAHTYWHRHERGQILQITSGDGWVVARGNPPRRVRKGDTLWVPPGEEHWHGAAESSFLVHVAISIGETEWFDEVDQREYAGVEAASGAAS